MKVAKDAVVALEYALHLGDGQIVDSSGEGPLRYLHGAGQIVPGLEAALEGSEVGTEKRVEVAPEQGYGEIDPQATRTVPREAFPLDAPIATGSEFYVVDDSGTPVPLRIVALEGGNVTVDFNHPLAGKTLHFNVKVLDIRAATAEELEHGHAHGEGGEDHKED